MAVVKENNGNPTNQKRCRYEAQTDFPQA